jgi:hypothetical protein
LLLTFFIPLLRFSKFIESPSDVRIGSKADLAPSNCDVCFTPKSGHSSRQSECLLYAKIGHAVISFRLGVFLLRLIMVRIYLT